MLKNYMYLSTILMVTATKDNLSFLMKSYKRKHRVGEYLEGENRDYSFSLILDE